MGIGRVGDGAGAALVTPVTALRRQQRATMAHVRRLPHRASLRYVLTAALVGLSDVQRPSHVHRPDRFKDAAATPTHLLSLLHALTCRIALLASRALLAAAAAEGLGRFRMPRHTLVT